MADGNAFDDSGLMARLLMRQRMMMVAAPVYLKAAGMPGTLDDLQRHECLVYRRQGASEIWRFPTSTGDLAEVAVKGRVGLDDIEMIASAAIDGFGIAYLPTWLVREAMEAERLVEVLPEATAARRTDIRALWPRAPYLPHRVRVAIDALVETLPSVNHHP